MIDQKENKKSELDEAQKEDELTIVTQRDTWSIDESRNSVEQNGTRQNDERRNGTKQNGDSQNGIRQTKESPTDGTQTEGSQSEERLLPPRSRFRLHTIEGNLPKGVYTIHVKPSSKAQSCQQYLIHQNFEGTLNLNQDYLFPYAENLSLRLDRMISDEVEHLVAVVPSTDKLTSEKITLNSERDKKARRSVQFRDVNGYVITIGLQWWLFNESEFTLIEAYVDCMDDKTKGDN